MEAASNGKVEGTTLKEVAETGDERKDGAFEEDGEYNHKVDVQSLREASAVDGNLGKATETQREKEEKDSSSSSSSSSDDEEDDDGEKDKKEEKIVPLVDVEESVAAQSDAAVSVEHVVKGDEAATEVPEKVDAAAMERKEETEAEIQSDETANGIVLTAGAEEAAPVAVDESDVVVPVVAGVDERVEEELVLAEVEENERDSVPAAADAAPKEHGVDSSLAQPPADAPAISEGGVAAEHDTDEGEIPESTGSPPIISVSRRTVPPTSWRSCCGLFDVLRRSDR
ncbi:hypothetical protein BT93_J1270 [Corymbia citriodora subsp. variegata]|nr:hypothetical protein BT93_J1270 [Corymbia citriodora subsp. variegata]